MQDRRLQLFGPPFYTDAERSTPLAPERLTQLAVVLAVRAEWVTRERLIGLLWPELPDEAARRNMRKLLFRARRGAWMSNIETLSDALRWQVATDVRDFERACERHAWDEAVRSYRGVLAEGFEREAAAPWLEWLRFERERLAGQFRSAAVHRLAELKHDLTARTELALRWLEVDPFDEDALATFVESARAADRPAEAVRAIAEFKRRVNDDLGIAPSARVSALSLTCRPSEPTLRHTDDFVGRRSELLELRAILLQPECRLLTVTGPGGVGKSSLLKRALPDLTASFADGVFWIALDDLAEPAQVVARIASELKIELHPRQEPLLSLGARLQTSHALVVLDNCEHLDRLASLLERLLGQTQHLKLCASSRTRLLMPGERLFPLNGLEVPGLEAPVEDLLEYEAVRLFVAAARAAKPDFEPRPQAGAIADVVRHVGGLPLAVLLAAHWTRLLPVAEIAAELQRSLDVLERSDIGEERAEHQSVRATFEQSWRLLTPNERRALASLSTFIGSFSRAAARQVAEASLPVLAALVDRSLLYMDEGRCCLHPLIRQFAAERLPEELASARQRHAEYFCGELRSFAGYVRADENTLTATLNAHLGDALQAIEWARAHARYDLLEAAIWALAQYFYLTGRCAEGLAALGTLPATAAVPTRAQAHVCAQHADGRARLFYQLARFEEAADSARRAFRYSRLAGDGEGVRTELSILATIAAKLGKLEESRRYSLQTMRLARSAGDPVGVATSLLNLGKVETGLGHWDAAIGSFRDALELNRNAGNQLGVIAALNNLGAANIDARRFECALGPLAEGLQLVDAARLTGLRSDFIANLARAKLELGENATAQHLAEEIAHSERARAEPGNVSDALVVLGQIARLDGRIADARSLLCEAARLASATEHVRAQMRCLLACVGLLSALGRRDVAAAFAAHVRVSPLATRAEQSAVEQYLPAGTAVIDALARPRLAEALQDISKEIATCRDDFAISD